MCPAATEPQGTSVQSTREACTSMACTHMAAPLISTVCRVADPVSLTATPVMPPCTELLVQVRDEPCIDEMTQYIDRGAVRVLSSIVAAAPSATMTRP